MTVIRPNSIAGITSITAQGENISFYRSDGVNISQFNANINASSGVSTIANLTVGFITATTASISGNVNVGGNVSIAGTLTYEDVTNVDSIGLVTARSGVILTGGTLTLGTGVTASGATSNTFTLSTNGSERVRVSSAGSFGVGTNNPSSLLDVAGNAKTSTLQIGTNPAGVSVGVLGIPNQKRIYGRNATNTGDVSIAYIDGNNRLVFGPNDNAFIDSSGRLGIGTVFPRGALDVTGNIFLSGGSQIQITGSSGTTGLQLIGQDAAESLIGTMSSQALVFRTSSTERARITSTGNFGINTQTPSSFANFTNLTIQGGTSGSNLDFFNSSGARKQAIVANASDGLSIECIGAGAINFNTNNTERARISSTGGFSLGTTANPGAGAIFATGDITAFYSSDIRLKKDIEPISEPIKKLMEISGVTYKWNEEYLKDKEVDGYFVRETEVGVIAQEVEKVLPEVVATRENGYKAVRYEKLVALLIEAVKDQQKQIDELKARLEEN